jgi:prepilin-type N-terminal cleavage/methylation domain-containing protein
MKFFNIQKRGLTHRQTRHGFTLIEMLVAVLIFSLGLVSLMSIASRGIAGNSIVADEISAQYLAAEGIEVVRHIRDTNYIAIRPWLSNGLDDCIGESCLIGWDFNASSGDPYVFLTQCNGGSAGCDDPLFLDAGNNFFSASGGGDETPFVRTIYIEEISQDEIRVISEVVWEQGRIERNVTMEEFFTNWQKAQA